MSDQVNDFKARMNSVKQLLEASKAAIASRLPKHLTADRMLKVALTAINKNPGLLECTTASLLQSIMTAAELGLECGGPLGEGYLVKYGKICQFIVGYRGMISLARRSGEILSIEAHVVYEADAFSCTLGLDPTLVHVPAWDTEDIGKMKFVYAVAKLRDGGTQFEVMSRKQVNFIKDASKAGSSGPWVTHFDEMARKTVIRRLFKYLPVSVELARAGEIQAQAEIGEFVIEGETIPEGTEATGPAPEKPKSKLLAALEGTTKATEVMPATHIPNPDSHAPNPLPLGQED